MRQAGEPSVEEILASIKKVIARDNRDSAAVERREREQRGMGSDGAVRQAQTADFDADDGEVLDLAELGEEVTEPASDNQLMASETVNSISESLAALAMMAQPPAAPQIVRSGETSLEGMVRDLLRPELAKWLDTNLPPLVERLVATEIARIVGKKG
ncbi:MAG: DUF2497 domain-containing protein [Novosphingobium sp.]|uniref:DUF2497 domain-containing protein n=1 Tax=Novosphingobium sp. TaxID=1874826 RepID=UPI003C7E0283